MHDVIVQRVSGENHVADVLGIQRNFQLQRILHRTNGGNGMHCSAYAADALNDSPRIARVAAEDDLLDAAPHLSGRPGLDHVAILDFDIDTKVTFNAGNWINGDSGAHATLLVVVSAAGWACSTDGSTGKNLTIRT
jgi:hypothetical protein